MHVLKFRPMPLRAAIAALFLLSFAPLSAMAQGGGVIQGVARTAEDNAPLALSLVRLVPSMPQGTLPEPVLTDTAGRFRFETVPAGDYRLQVERIGYERTLSPVLRLAAGATVTQDVRSGAKAIQLSSLSVRPGGACFTAEQVARDPELATLWNEAKKGVELRRAFELQYRFARTLRQDVRMNWRLRSPTQRHTENTSISNPDSIIARQRRAEALHREQGYTNRGRGRFLLEVPNEKELLDEEFLRDHCINPNVDREDGAFALRFAPVSPRRDQTSIRGVVWVDERTFLIRRIEFEYVEDGRAYAQSSIEYGEVAVGGRSVRLPTRGTAEVHGGNAALSSASANLTYTYRDFQRVN